MSETLQLVSIALTSGVGAWVGPYLNSYLQKKGENLATHEDIGLLVDQVQAVTKTTKEIEAKISNEVWDRQKLWELKREVLFSAAKRVSETLEILNSLYAMYTVAAADPQADTAYMMNQRGEKMRHWHKGLGGPQ